MDIKISYEEVKANHSDIVDMLITKMRASNSKDKDKSEKDFEWSYSYGVAVKGMSFGEMINQAHNKIDDERDKSSYEIINTKLKSVIGLSLSVSAGRTKRYVALSDKPKLFVEKFSEIYKADIEKEEKEKERISKLTPEERERETQENINKLSDMGGFMGFNIGPDGIKPILPKEIEYDVDDILDKIGRVGMAGLTDEERKFLDTNSK